MLFTRPEVTAAARFRELLHPTGITAYVRAGNGSLRGTISVHAKGPRHEFSEEEQRTIKNIALSMSLRGKYREIFADGPHSNSRSFTFALPTS